MIQQCIMSIVTHLDSLHIRLVVPSKLFVTFCLFYILENKKKNPLMFSVTKSLRIICNKRKYLTALSYFHNKYSRQHQVQAQFLICQCEIKGMVEEDMGINS